MANFIGDAPKATPAPKPKPAPKTLTYGAPPETAPKSGLVEAALALQARPALTYKD